VEGRDRRPAARVPVRGTTLPPGAHRRVMKPSADRPLPGMARLVGEFLDRLGLADVTLVGNDSGGAITQMLIRGGAP
jgi:pimeloyl-ACP methyl ester carboxylesterase